MSISKILVVAVVLCGSYEALAVTRAQCTHEFNKCRKDFKNILNQGKCKKARNNCEAQADQESAQNNTKSKMLGGFQENNMKSKMLNGQAGDSNTMDNYHSKAAAQQRLLERKKATSNTSAKDKMMGRDL